MRGSIGRGGSGFLSVEYDDGGLLRNGGRGEKILQTKGCVYEQRSFGKGGVMKWIKTEEQLPDTHKVTIEGRYESERSNPLLGYWPYLTEFPHSAYSVVIYERGVSEGGGWEQWIVGADEVDPPEQWTVIEPPEEK